MADRRGMLRPLLYVCAALLPGCVTTETRSASAAPAPAVATAPMRAWAAQGPDGATLGYVVRFAEDRAQTPRGFFSVRNPYQQELGLVDDLGRSWRFEAHQSEPTWLGTGSVAEATSRILGQPVVLVDAPLATLTKPPTAEN